MELEHLLALVTSVETSQRGYLLTENDSYLQSYNDDVSRVRRQVETIITFEHRQNRVQIGSENLRPIVTAKMSELDQTIQLAKSESFAAAKKMVLSDQGKNLMDQLRLRIVGMEGEIMAYRMKLDFTTAQQGLYTQWASIAGYILILFLLAWTFRMLLHEIGHRAKAEADVQKLNLSLQTQLTELNSVNQELEAFSYSVSHDLRAPLRHINGFVDLMQNSGDEKLSDKSNRYLGIIADSARQMGRLIDDLLVFSRMSRTELKTTMIGLDDVVRQTLSDLQLEMKDRNIVWKHHPLPVVLADRSLLYQVFSNLIANALKYSRTRNPAEIEIGWQRDQENNLVVFVHDNGVGFDMQYANKLFGVFQRLHRAEDFEGTGIGLANVRRIISRHGGKTWGEGKVDGGATFYFSLPLTPEQIVLPAPDENTSAPTQK